MIMALAALAGFTYTGLPARVVFGAGARRTVRVEAERLAITRALVLTTPAQAAHGRAVLADLGDRAVGMFDGAVMHTPVEVTETALAAARALAADGVIAVGGGSAIGLGKALAVRRGMPQIALATTYAGSEMTPILGETERGKKTTRTSPDILPETVIYDVELTLDLPVGLSVTSGLNAIAHAVEALYARDTNPITSLLAEQGITALAGALPVITRAPADPAARTSALYGAWLCGTCLGSVGMALHHKLCHVLGGAFALPHSETHAVVLPHAIAYNAPAAPDAMARIAGALRAAGVSEPAGGAPSTAAGLLYDLERSVGAPRALADLGLPRDALDHATELALAQPYWNPRPIERGAIRALLEHAFTGSRPA